MPSTEKKEEKNIKLASHQIVLAGRTRGQYEPNMNPANSLLGLQNCEWKFSRWQWVTRYNSKFRFVSAGMVGICRFGPSTEWGQNILD